MMTHTFNTLNAIERLSNGLQTDFKHFLRTYTFVPTDGAWDVYDTDGFLSDCNTFESCVEFIKFRTEGCLNSFE